MKGRIGTISIVLISIIILLGSGLTVSAQEDRSEFDEKVTLIFTVPDPELVETDNVLSVTIDGWGSSHSTDHAILPQKSVYIPVDRNDIPSISGVRDIGENRITVGHSVKILQPPVTDGYEIEITDEADHDSCIDLRLIRYGRSSLMHLRMNPFSIEDGELVYPDMIEIDLVLSGPVSRDRVNIPDDLPSPADVESDDEPAAPLWSPDVGSEFKPADSGYFTGTRPDIQMAIITTSTMNSSLQDLAEWKTRRGVYTAVYEIGWINSNIAGSDSQAKIRNLLIDLWENEDLQFVLLGGDHSDVPTRAAYVPDGYDDTGSDGSYAPTDAYYSDLDGSGHTPYDWDGDNDGYYGEYSVDGIDLIPEVYVGRLSASSSSAMDDLVENIINYEKNPPSGSWFNRSVLAGAYSNYDRPNSPEYNDTTDEADLKEAIRKDFLNSGNYSVYRLYEQAGIWPSQQTSDGSLTMSNLEDEIDDGAFMVNMAGHGNYVGIYRTIWNSDSNSNGLCDSGETSTTAFYSQSASQSNGGKKPLFYNNACGNGEFDRRWSLTEDIVRDVGIGAVGASRVSWYSVHWSPGSDGGYYNQGHDYRFWEQFFDDNYQPGKALYKSKYDYINDKTVHNAQVWKNLLQYNLIGDPEINIWTQSPDTFNVTYSEPIPTPGNYTFMIKDSSGDPVEGARICLMNGSSFYGYCDTNESGKGWIVLPEIAMKMNLTVTGHNFKPYEKEVMVGIDKTKPEIGSVSLSGNTTTGDDYIITASVTDNVEVANVTIRHAYSSSQPSSPTNSTMVHDGGLFMFNSTHPSDSTLDLWYSIGACDLRGNWNHSTWYHSGITDDDAPSLVSDSTSSNGTTGDTFDFTVSVSDNIGVQSVYVEYWYGTGSHTNSSMSGTGPYTYGITVPLDSLDSLNYTISAVDSAGNWFTSGTETVTISDNDLPTLSNDHTPSSGTTGDPFTFSVDSSDNIGVQKVVVNHYFVISSAVNSTMTGSGPFSLTITIPSDSVLDLHYSFLSYDTSGNVKISDWVTVSISDDDNPSFDIDNTPSYGTTGDTITLSVDVSDNIDVQSVYVEYRFGTGTVTNASMTGSGTYSLVVDVPSDMIDDLHYSFHALDSSGNWAGSTETSVQILDNDLPVFMEDLSDVSATTGDAFTFSVSVSDNIGIDGITVEYWQGTGVHSNLSMSGTGPYTLTIDLPESSVETLHYLFHAGDPEGNWAHTLQVDVDVGDNDRPLILDDLSDSTGTTGDQFRFMVNSTDNIGVDGVSVEYWFGDDASDNISMVGEGDSYTASIEIPSDSTDDLHYIFHSGDQAGNWETSSEVTIPIEDDDRPEFIAYLTGDAGTTGDTFDFMMTIVDNVEMNSVYVVYRFGSGDPVNETLLFTSDYFLSIDLPADSLDPMYYQFFAVDINGNWANTSEVMVTISDDDHPFLVLDGSDDEAFTGDVFNFEMEVGDNIGISDVYVEYRIGGSGWTNASMEGTDRFTTVITIPDDESGDLEYRFLFSDSSGNWNATEDIEFPIKDNDLPELISSEFDSEEYGTGDTVSLEVEWSDNIGISNVTAEYWFGSADHETVELSSSGSSYVFEVELPVDSLDELHIIIHAVDGSGNANSTSYDISYADTISPVIDPIDDIFIYQGDEVDLTASASDNIGIATYGWTGLTTPVSGQRLTRVFEEAGIHEITLTVTDQGGNTAQEDLVITVYSSDRDGDGDGIPDLDEIDKGLDPEDETDGGLDPDDDGMTNSAEFSAGTDMNDPDTDEDGMPDGWEFNNELDALTPSADQDADLDGILDLDEYLGETDPQVSDLEDDGDGGSDSYLIFIIIGSVLLVLILLGIIGTILFVKLRKKDEDEGEESTEEWDN